MNEICELSKGNRSKTHFFRYFMTRFFVTLFFLIIAVGAFADWNGNSKKKEGDDPGLITTFSFGDRAPMDRYFHIVSALASDSSTMVLKTDSIAQSMFLCNAFPLPICDPVFRFDKDPYDQYYKILLGKTHDNCMDVMYNYSEQTQRVVISHIGYGMGQSFYLKHIGNGRYKIFHSSGKALSIRSSADTAESEVFLVDDINQPEVFWMFIDPSSNEVYQPL
ncbi:MAG: hypothetical protein PHU27_13025 [Salinivirgaceae bacterium]|nr:hypothetical protein [Salinivirgaceae bacterium]MDD4748211.1 hypothetical protein [Salinivirgaceae bacterium]MDY0281860.1 hypothetical protein [Salinivirgaceae bacterium]